MKIYSIWYKGEYVGRFHSIVEARRYISAHNLIGGQVIDENQGYEDDNRRGRVGFSKNFSAVPRPYRNPRNPEPFTRIPKLHPEKTTILFKRKNRDGGEKCKEY